MRLQTRQDITEYNIIHLLDEHRDILKRYKVKRIGLFGSYVRRKQKKEYHECNRVIKKK